MKGVKPENYLAFIADSRSAKAVVELIRLSPLANGKPFDFDYFFKLLRNNY